MKRVLVLATALGLVLAACSEKDKQALSSPCGPAPTTLANVPAAARAFPAASGFRVTAVHQRGPSTVIDGFVDTDFDVVFTGFQAALKAAPAGFQVTHTEKDVADAEVNFSGHNTTGQVKLAEECAGRTSVTITIRPA